MSSSEFIMTFLTTITHDFMYFFIVVAMHEKVSLTDV